MRAYLPGWGGTYSKLHVVGVFPVVSHGRGQQDSLIDGLSKLQWAPLLGVDMPAFITQKGWGTQDS